MTEEKVSKPKPRWWRPYWIILVIVTIALGVAYYFFLNAPLQDAIIALILALLCIGFDTIFVLDLQSE